ncbi:DNA cytosine methyltransferase [Tritonibacter scottomollicae]|uniref:DNA cytosine methyltransferase n=1 Tax=Tritonibacter scottomollicae TaxID=483013 RepID=UPI003BABBC32
MPQEIGIIDLFAGPGGLAEGFSSVKKADGSRAMKVELSIEKEAVEVRTLQLRTFLRGFEHGFPQEYYEALNSGSNLPDWAELYPRRWEAACQEARQIELGSPQAFEEIEPILKSTRERYHGHTVLIGGPPCQAYSLAGRSRNRGKVGYVAEDDHRHFLYREYVRILDALNPAAFVMENVKGMLSSKVGGGEIFQRVLDDLRNAGDGYQLMPLAAERHGGEINARDFVVRAEEHGVPQARHRVFIVGLRNDLMPPAGAQPLLQPVTASDSWTSVSEVISDMPRIRSGLSRQPDDAALWQRQILDQAGLIRAASDVDAKIRQAARRLLDGEAVFPSQRKATRSFGIRGEGKTDLERWLRDPNLARIQDHDTRSHIPGDLGRYLFAALYGAEHGSSPKLSQFPEALQPQHRNRASGAFADRFRVQVESRPSSTVTSHISKDGHYFIHPDPAQARSLTVREAARLQTFPDNYHFCGNRTRKYHQVGNAVPPYLAFKIGEVIRDLID